MSNISHVYRNTFFLPFVIQTILSNSLKLKLVDTEAPDAGYEHNRGLLHFKGLTSPHFLLFITGILIEDSKTCIVDC